MYTSSACIENSIATALYIIIWSAILQNNWAKTGSAKHAFAK